MGLFVGVVVIIGAIVITPIIVGAVAAGYWIAYTLHAKDGSTREELIKIFFPLRMRVSDFDIILNLEQFENEFIFNELSRIWNVKNLLNICFDGSVIFHVHI